MKIELFCYGEIGVDNIVQVPHLPSPELAAFPTSDTYHIGGAAANTAVWMAHMGHGVALGGNAIGQDQIGRQLWAWLNKHPRIDLALINRKEDQSTPLCRVLVTPDGERSFLIYGYRETSSLSLQARHLAGVTYLALDMYGGEPSMRAAEVARAAGVKTAAGDVIKEDHPVLPLVHIVTNSAAFMRQALPGVDIREQTHRLQALNKGLVIATDGAHEIYAVDEDGAAWRARPPVVTAVDATGAGDAFRSGLLSGLLRGLPLPRALCLGAAAGALKVQRIGAASDLPAAADIEGLANTLQAQPVI